jgi:hypothetical protein
MRVIELQTNHENMVLVEIAEDFSVANEVRRSGGAIAGAGPAAETIKKLEGVGEAIADVCQTLQTRIQEILKASKPDELTLEFGVKLAGEKGIPLVAKATAEGTFKVTAKWCFSKSS